MQISLLIVLDSQELLLGKTLGVKWKSYSEVPTS